MSSTPGNMTYNVKCVSDMTRSSVMVLSTSMLFLVISMKTEQQYHWCIEFLLLTIQFYTVDHNGHITSYQSFCSISGKYMISNVVLINYLCILRPLG